MMQKDMMKRVLSMEAWTVRARKVAKPDHRARALNNKSKPVNRSCQIR